MEMSLILLEVHWNLIPAGTQTPVPAETVTFLLVLSFDVVPLFEHMIWRCIVY